MISDDLATKLRANADFNQHVQYEENKPYITLTAGEIRSPSEELPDNRNSQRLQLQFLEYPDTGKSLQLFQAWKRENGESGFNKLGLISIKDLLNIDIVENKLPATN